MILLDYGMLERMPLVIAIQYRFSHKIRRLQNDDIASDSHSQTLTNAMLEYVWTTEYSKIDLHQKLQVVIGSKSLPLLISNS